jgi:hypothetical protein
VFSHLVNFTVLLKFDFLTISISEMGPMLRTCIFTSISVEGPENICLFKRHTHNEILNDYIRAFAVTSVSFLTVEYFFSGKNYKENTVWKIYFKSTTVSFRALPMDLTFSIYQSVMLPVHLQVSNISSYFED